LLAVLAGVFAGGARAAVVNMDYLGPYGNNSGGIYVYPYTFNINSSVTPIDLMCDDFNHEISAGATWTAETLNASDLNSITVTGLQYPAAGVTGYLEACDLFVQEVNAFNAGNSDPSGLYNWATWDLLTGVDHSASALDAGSEAQVQSYLSAAEAAGSSLSPSDFSNVIIYTPTDMSSGGPQEFLGITGSPINVPEPGTIALVALGATGLLVRRRWRAV
jgi:hypothetical protein